MDIPKGIEKLFKRNKEDIKNEFFTPDYVIEPLIKYLKRYEKKINKKLKIWCPFSLEKDLKFEEGTIFASRYIKIFKKHGFEVISSHILEGKNFFEYQPKEYDIIIDNPPFKGRNKIFEHALSLNKPFLFLMILTCLNDKNPLNLFLKNNKEIQIMFFNDRVSFIKPDGKLHKKPPFGCGYIGTGDILPKNTVIEDIINNKKEFEKNFKN